MENPAQSLSKLREGLKRGQRIYQGFCIGCHGPIGDGMGPAEPYLYPPPLNFTILRDRAVSGGILYYQIMNGITGTAMPYFKRELESEKIWDVGDYVAVTFIGQSDAYAEPRGIDASFMTRGPAFAAVQPQRHATGRGEERQNELLSPLDTLVGGRSRGELAGFFWALRNGQFSDQDRARYLPLRGEADRRYEAAPAASRGVYGLLAVFLICGLTLICASSASCS